jgi:hypothetical protein
MTQPDQRDQFHLKPERVAYWYLRLNGFLQMENFVVHPERRGGQRTDADLLAVRFPYRAERLFDEPAGIMEDDCRGLSLSSTVIDVVIAEVTGNQPCKLNGPWTDPSRRNMQRVLAAIGCLPTTEIETAAKDIYRTGVYEQRTNLRIRLVAIGRDRNPCLEHAHRHVTQVTWRDVLPFMWWRFNAYWRQKRDVDQWDKHGKWLRQLADDSADAVGFTSRALRSMGIDDEPGHADSGAPTRF